MSECPPSEDRVHIHPDPRETRRASSTPETIAPWQSHLQGGPARFGTVAPGLALAGLPAVYEAGLRFAVERILRLVVVLREPDLSLLAVGRIGVRPFPMILGCIVCALVFAVAL